MSINMRRSSARLLAVVLAVAAAMTVLFCLLRKWEDNKFKIDVTDDSDTTEEDPYEDDDEAMTFIGGKWYVSRKGIETILLLGIDKFDDSISGGIAGFSNNQQTDFIMLLILDHANKTYQVLQINRDTMADIQIFGVDGKLVGTKNAQLALAHTYGSGGNDSCEYAAKAVSDYLYGIKINHYLSLTMDAVPEINDIAGGVTITMLEDLTPIDESFTEGATVTLEGDQALAFVRARGSLEDSSNISRMERQRQYLHALHQQMREKIKESNDFLLTSILDISSYLVSDCTINQLSDIGNAALEYSSDGEIMTIAGEAVKGDKYMEFYADEEALRSTVLGLFYVETDMDE